MTNRGSPQQWDGDEWDEYAIRNHRVGELLQTIFVNEAIEDTFSGDLDRCSQGRNPAASLLGRQSQWHRALFEGGRRPRHRGIERDAVAPRGRLASDPGRF